MEIRICVSCLVTKMRYALCNLASNNFIAFSVSITRFVKCAASGSSEPQWKPSFKVSFLLLLSWYLLNFLLWGRTAYADVFGFSEQLKHNVVKMETVEVLFRLSYRVCVCVCVCARARAWVCAFWCALICVRARARACACACVRVCVRACVCVCVCVCRIVISQHTVQKT